MKGYLQRLAESAITPSPAIRPVLGPVYAPRRFEAEPEPIASASESPVETVTERESLGPKENLRPQPPKTSPSPGIPAPVNAILPRVVAPEEPRVIAPDEKGLQAHAEFKPVVQSSPSASNVPLAFPSAKSMPRSEGNPVSTARPEPPVVAGAKWEMPISAAAPRPGDPGPGVVRQRELPRFAFEPLIPVPAVIVASDPASYPQGNEHPDSQPSDSEPDPVRLLSRTRDRKADIDRRSEPINRGALQERTLRERSMRRERPVRAQPDEVQIHIGRIEVTAVPPAAPPAIRKATRKSLSLSEYLSRGR